MSHQQAQQIQAVETAEIARKRKAYRRRKKALTAADFDRSDLLRVRLKFHDGREIYMSATVVDAVYGKIDGRTFDHVVVRLETPSEAFAKDIPMIDLLAGHLFLLDYSRSSYWLWRINTVQWVPE